MGISETSYPLAEMHKDFLKDMTVEIGLEAWLRRKWGSDGTWRGIMSRKGWAKTWEEERTGHAMAELGLRFSCIVGYGKGRGRKLG